MTTPELPVLTDAELDAILAQYPGYIAIARLVAELRATRAELARAEDALIGLHRS